MSSRTVVEVRGLEEILEKLRQYPGVLAKSLQLLVESGLLVLWENVPPYPEPPSESTYQRTGTLGRTLGGGEGGGAGGMQPDIYEVHQLGDRGFEGRFGTNLDYAPFVIGDEEQAWMHQGRWWTMSNIAERAKDKIISLAETVGKKLEAWLNGQAQPPTS